MADDGFHEIQLGKKQLVFAFMAGAVMLVVVFLIGVWVGKETRRPEAEIAAEVPTADVTPDTPQPPTQVAATELDYTARLQGGGAAPVGKTDAAAKPVEPPPPAPDAGTDTTAAATPPPPAAKTAPKTTPATPLADAAAKKTAPAATTAPAAGTWHLQAAAFKDKKPADTLVARLVKKGYAASVFSAATGVYKYKVQIGPFADRASAETTSAKLKKEEGLSPLVQR